MGDRDGDKQRQQHVDVVRQLEREDDAGERRPHRAAEDRGHADQRPEAGAVVGQEQCASRPPSAPPMIRSGASTPPEVPEPSETAQMSRLDDEHAEDQRAATSPCSSSPMMS